jgi:hypothetical protein
MTRTSTEEPSMNEPIADWLASDPEGALEAAEQAAREQIPGYLGVCVACILSDHGRDKYPDLNIHELAYALLMRRGGAR